MTASQPTPPVLHAQPFLRALGLMSGTSLDGVDVGLIKTDGQSVEHIGATATYPYTPQEQLILRQALQEAVGLQTRDVRDGVLKKAEALITRTHIEAVKRFLVEQNLKAQDIDVIGFHGQTVLHRPEKRLTVQLGNGATLAQKTGIRVVNDFRSADVAAGGQGAPLVPILHQALVRSRSDIPLPCVVVNIGGVANITYITAQGEPLACDVGSGNALLDDFMLTRTGIAMDKDGACAAKGKVDQARLHTWMAHPFFALPLPKSLDRNDFSHISVADLSIEDGAATLTAFTAHGIAHILRQLPEQPKQWLVCGGGAYNPTVMQFLAKAVEAPVMATDVYGWPADGLEALAFGFLAVRSLYGLPLSFPSTTGVAMPTCGGVVWPCA
jgi:anhydro-N-acetylmuramic acid kinase